jgi:hypothetical protein
VVIGSAGQNLESLLLKCGCQRCCILLYLKLILFKFWLQRLAEADCLASDDVL